MAIRHLIIIALALMAHGCTGAEPPLGGEDEARYDHVYKPGDRQRMAQRTQLPGPPSAKGDGSDDIRYGAPDRYAITVPPSRSIRPMVEWEPMQAVMMGTPGYVANSPDTLVTVTGIAKHTLEDAGAEVWFIAPSAQTRNKLKTAIVSAGVAQDLVDTKVRFLLEPLDSIWFIDYGPLPIVDDASQSFALADFRYYHDRALDDGLSTFIGREMAALGNPNPAVTYRMPTSTEGGTFQATSDGICITGTRQLYYMTCASGGCDNNLTYQPLDELQEHPMTLQLEAVWGPYLGCQDVIVTYSVTDDGTGHIDMYLKVIDDQTVMLGEYVAPFSNQAQATNATRMNQNADFFESYTKPDGTNFSTVRLVMPGHRSSNWGDVPFTYINSTFVNGPTGKVNIWPATLYQDWEDSRDLATEQWQAAMPGWEHAWVDSTALSFNSGAVHCITRTIPDLAPGLWVEDGTCNQGGECVGPEDGYAGACSPNDISYQVCYGPSWECTCQYCETGCTYVPDGTSTGCGDLTYEGCCDGNTLRYCEGASIETLDCGTCGWDAGSGWYDCGVSGADPSGEFPRECGAEPPVCEPDCGFNVCGDDGCGGSCGTCEGNGLCVDGHCLCEPECGFNVCGDDGCGGSCGSCADGELCQDGHCLCVPQCDGKQCGDDGCGGSCGTCEGDEACDEAGLCQGDNTCAPACDDRQCGDDGCGGSCGSCGDGQSCNDGQCVADPGDAGTTPSEDINPAPGDAGVPEDSGPAPTDAPVSDDAGNTPGPTPDAGAPPEGESDTDGTSPRPGGTGDPSAGTGEGAAAPEPGEGGAAASLVGTGGGDGCATGGPKPALPLVAGVMLLAVASLRRRRSSCDLRRHGA